jgi:predicted nucleotidyltransferase component of viral defense system
MKDHLAHLVQESASPLEARNVMREYLQARVLACMQRQGAMVPLAFHGGTALRFLYALPRHSEDLDFALERQSSEYSLDKYAALIERDLHREGYQVETRRSDDRVVQNAWVRFRGLLYEMGLSGHREEITSLKIEVDTNPPRGAGLQTTVVRRYVTMQLQHHDRSSLLAGKIHAVLQRSFTKGRDVYDLLWYLSDPEWPSPNLILLRNALAETGWQGPEPTEGNWRGIVRHRIEQLDWRNVRQDVAPFLERADEIDLLSRENLLLVLG